MQKCPHFRTGSTVQDLLGPETARRGVVHELPVTMDTNMMWWLRRLCFENSRISLVMTVKSALFRQVLAVSARSRLLPI